MSRASFEAPTENTLNSAPGVSTGPPALPTPSLLAAPMTTVPAASALRACCSISSSSTELPGVCPGKPRLILATSESCSTANSTDARMSSTVIFLPSPTLILISDAFGATPYRGTSPTGSAAPVAVPAVCSPWALSLASPSVPVVTLPFSASAFSLNSRSG